MVENGSDESEIAGLVRCFVEAFTSGEGVDARLDALRAAMLPGAVIVRTCGQEPAPHDVESFIAPRRRMLTDGTLADFSEEAGRGRLEVFGDLAHWFGRYTKDGLYRGEPYPGAGMKSVQLVRTSAGWRISAVAWDDDRDGLGAEDHRTRDLTP